ncbi:hypothetical protein C8J56DRAFT_979709 [Mycena floridula]|nr:hypothetical protein C8J56DRAFT_979709 [Mycena floridula]
MPRGIPNVKRDDTGLRYTTFNVPLGLNPKHVASTYLKTESQTMWHRNGEARKAAVKEEGATPQDQSRRGSQVLVIHPGSRFLRVGRASEVNPVTVPNVLARKTTFPVPPLSFVEGISRPRKGRQMAARQSDDESPVTPSDDPFEEKLSHISNSLRARMRFYKLRVTPNSSAVASTFNESFKPEIIADHDDAFALDASRASSEKPFLVGEEALELADPEESNYLVRWPIYGSNFNTRDYPSIQVLLDDIEEILRTTLRDKLDIEPRDYKNFSVVLVIPDFYDRTYVRHFVNILLVSMGFKQLCAQQESLAATYGAGIPAACVVDIGAKTTSIACVDEGLVIADSRMFLNIGGDDITEFLWVLLDRICFPYQDINLARSYDWQVMEDLKARLCTLSEASVSLNLYDFVVRKPRQPAEKYGLRAYDEIIMAPMCIFEPRVVEFDRKRIGMQLSASHLDVTEEILELTADHMSAAMMISTQHLMPGTSPPASTPKKDAPQVDSADVNGDVVMDIVDVEEESKPSTSQLQSPSKNMENGSTLADSAFNRGYSIDVCFEASKLPLDVAIFNSVRSTGGDDKIKKYLQNVLVIGGSALIPGMAHALESRLQAIATPLITNMEKVQIIPPPKEVDPRVLAWKGAAVLGKMEGASELWVTPGEWDILGMRGLKERCFFL